MPWNFDKSTPIYLQIADVIQKRIVCGVYPRGSQIPTVRDFAIEASVNPNTMQRALAALEGNGLIETRGTLGRFVTTDENVLNRAKADIAHSIMKAYLNDMNSIGIDSNSAVLLVSDHVKEMKEND